ncbi:MAG TPA: cell division protein ZipA C-terminal FtsZ-binding domain-containing protein [Burkholderiales bacterium]|nr:cell division protein ZipA C-terminal FtsZ-binding domain-containing protein [Burkholderiales bacterium]
MNDLFVILGIVAVLLIGGVAIYNKIQERKYRRRSDEAFHHRHDDVLLSEERATGSGDRIEPQLTDVVSDGNPPASKNEAQRELDRPWVSTLPEPTEWEPSAEGGEAAKSSADDDSLDPLPSATLYEPRTTAPPGSVREPRAPQPRLYERPAAGDRRSQHEPRSSIPPGRLRDPNAPPTPRSPAGDEPRSSIPPGRLRDPTVPPRAPAASRSSIPPGSLREPVAPREQVQDDRPRQKIPAAKEFDLPHPSLDYVVRIQLDRPHPASALSPLVAHLRQLKKPVRIAGLNSASGKWEELRGSASYKELSVGLQLADRSGPASDTDISRFSEMLRRAAGSLKARAHCPPLHQALANAIELDQFCADVDVTIGLNIIARRSQPFAVSRVAALAEAIGFTLAANGNFEFNAEDGSVVFSLCDQEGAAFTGGRMNGVSTRGVTLLLDVPRVAEGLPAFEAMVTLANDLCEPLDGVLVDDNGKPLNERGIENIRAQLRDIYDRMQARQISAGSARARRLFS